MWKIIFFFWGIRQDDKMIIISVIFNQRMQPLDVPTSLDTIQEYCQISPTLLPGFFTLTHGFPLRQLKKDTLSSGQKLLDPYQSAWLRNQSVVPPFLLAGALLQGTTCTPVCGDPACAWRIKMACLKFFWRENCKKFLP